jgi:transposase
MSNVLQVKGYSADQIKSLMNTDDNYKIGVRLFAVLQVANGYSSRKLEEFYQTSFKQITNWVHRFEKEGLEGLKDKAGRGRKSNLNDEHREELTKILNKDTPLDHGYNTATWTGPILIDWIKNKYNIEYKKTQIYNVLKELGFSHQKAKGNYPEADLKKQETFKEDLKKTTRKSK